MSRSGQLKINGKDAYDMFGAFLLDGAAQALMTPAAVKPLIENNSRMQHGKRVILKDSQGNTLIRKADRDITLPFCIKADNPQALLQQLNAFEEELNSGEINMTVADFPSTVFHLIHKGNPTPSGHIRGMALFSFKFNEPNPNNRS